MGLLDFLSSDGFGAAGSWVGTVGSGLGAASAFTDGAASDGLGIASGGASALSGLMGIGGGIGTLLNGSSKSDDRLDAWFNIGEGALGALGGAADMAAGGFGLGDNNKGKGVSQMISGGIGILGSLLSGGKAIYDIRKAHKGGDASDKVAAWSKLAGSATSLFGGIVNIGQGKHEYNGDSSSGAAKAWNTAGKVGAVAGLIPGLIGSVMDTKKAFGK